MDVSPYAYPTVSGKANNDNPEGSLRDPVETMVRTTIVRCISFVTLYINKNK